MCYSAKVQADYRQYVRLYGADIDLDEFTRIYFARAVSDAIKIPKAVDAALLARPEIGAGIATAIAQFQTRRAAELETELFRQRARLIAAERKVQEKATKVASNEVRIAMNKVDAAQRGLDELRRTSAEERDSRIFPGMYAPVLVELDGRRLVVPMRYRCRLPHWTEDEERRKPGSYNARTDKLGTAWRGVFGHTHGILLVDAFFEHVDQAGRDAVLRFDPNPPQQMQVACLWTRTRIPGSDDLWSFAAITDDPPPEVAAAGHDRCIVPLKTEHVDAWLNPDSRNRNVLTAILADREQLYYEHELAA